MATTKDHHRSCTPKDKPSDAKRSRSLSLPVVAVDGKTVRASKMGPWRAGALITVHILVAAHIIHWLTAKKTISPVEPSESMYTLNNGHLNAGFIFFILAILSTILLGRFFCGWACHVVAYQDFCAWLMKKIGIKPKPFRSRLLILAPLALAIYMFIWPTVFRLWVGAPAPHLTNEIITTEFWKTFPGPIVAALTFLICGFVIVYFLGAKGFCTYGCPYGGFFGLVDPVAVGRIRVTDACEHCGHCTAVCTSNVKVHEEVALFGMVVDPGCMKCMDCVSVCPNDALYWGIGKPAIGTKPSSPRKPANYDFALWEELLMVAIGLWGLYTFRGLYGHIPLLMAMGMSAIFAYVVMKLIRIVRDSNVRLQNLTLKHGGNLTVSGKVFVASMAMVLALTAHSSAVQWEGSRGQRLFADLNIAGTQLAPGKTWWTQATSDQREQLDRAIVHFDRADRWGFLSTDIFLDELARSYYARDQRDLAEKTVRRMIDLYPKNPIPLVRLADLQERAGKFDEAESTYKKAVEISPTSEQARSSLCQLLASRGRTKEAYDVFAEHVLLHKDSDWTLKLVDTMIRFRDFASADRILERLKDVSPKDARIHLLSGQAAFGMEKIEHAEQRLRRAIELDPTLADAHYALAQVLQQQQRWPEVLAEYQACIRYTPTFADAHHNMAAVLMITGKPTEALSYAREAVRLNPKDASHHGLLIDLLTHLNDKPGAEEARRQYEKSLQP